MEPEKKNTLIAKNIRECKNLFKKTVVEYSLAFFQKKARPCMKNKEQIHLAGKTSPETVVKNKFGKINWSETINGLC